MLDTISVENSGVFSFITLYFFIDVNAIVTFFTRFKSGLFYFSDPDQDGSGFFRRSGSGF